MLFKQGTINLGCKVINHERILLTKVFFKGHEMREVFGTVKKFQTTYYKKTLKRL